MSSAEIYTGVNRATIYNMRRGLISVKLKNILQFARAVAPKGMEDAVEQRWLQIATRGETSLPEVDYSFRPDLSESDATGEPSPENSRLITNPRLVETVDYLETLPPHLFEPLFATIREMSFAVSSNRSRRRNKDDAGTPGTLATAQ